MKNLAIRAARRARAAVLPVAARLPRDVGPTPLRRLAQDGRIAVATRQLKQDPHAALAALDRELTEDAPPAAWRGAAQAAHRAGLLERSVALDTRALELDYAQVNDLVRLRSTAAKLKDVELASRALHRLNSLTPSSQFSLDSAAKALRLNQAADVDEVRALRERVVARGKGLNLHALDDAITELELLGGLEADPSQVEEVIRRTVRDRPEHTTTVVRVLTRARAFDRLETLLDQLSEDRLDRVPGSAWGQTARRASSAGWSALAARTAALGLRQNGSHEDLRAIVEAGRDEAGLLERGWAPPPRAALAHTPRPDAVLSVLGQSLPIRSGGYATRSHGILSSLVARGWDMAAATRLGFPYDLWWSPDDPRPVAPVDVVDGVPYHRLLHPGVRDYPRVPLEPYVEDGARAIASLARDHGAALVHAASLYDVGMAGLTAARQLGVPFVYEMRGLKQLLEGARDPGFPDSPRGRYLDMLESSVAREADAVLVITRALGDRMVELGVDPERITVVPNGVHVDRFTPRPRDEELAATLGLTGRTVIGYVGGLVVYEGLELLLRAAVRLRQDSRDVHLLIVGDGTHERTLRVLAEQLGVADVVTFTGRVPHDVVESYLSLIDIAPFPRQPMPVCELISPIKPFESMAMEKAVVVSDVAALTEIVQDGVTGRTFRKGDSDDLARVLGELLDDPEQRTALGRAARTWVIDHHDWSTVTDAVDATYRSVLGGASAGSSPVTRA